MVDRLRPGPNSLSREEIVRDQRRRIVQSLGECLTEKGYAHTTVADIISRAHVSRQTFYQLYDGKQACLLDVFARARRRLVDNVFATDPDAAPLDRFDRVVRGYLDVMTKNPAIARVFLVEIYAAGPSALRERLILQQGTADLLADGFDLVTDEDRFACRAVIAVIVGIVTQELVLGSAESADELYEPLVAMARKMLQPSASQSS